MATETKHTFKLTAKDATKSTLTSVGDGFSSLGDKVNATGKVAAVGLATVAAGATAAGAAIGALTVSSFGSLDTLGKFADRLDIGTSALTSLRYAANQTAGVSDGQLDTALQRMVRRVSQAAAGTGEAVKVLDELNLSATELNQLSPDQQFSAIADAIQGVENQSDKVRLTFGLFDSEGVGLVNTLNQGSEGLATFAAEADALGITMERSAIAKVEAANDAMDNMKRSTSAIGNEMAVNLAPIVTGIANLWVENVAKTTDWGKIAETTVNYAVTGFAMVADGVQNVATILQFAKVGAYSLANSFAQLFVNSTEAAASFLNFFGTGLKMMVIGSLELVRKLGETLAMLPGRAGDAGDNLVANIDRMQSGIDEALTIDASKVTAGIQGVGDAYENALQDLDTMVKADSWGDKILQTHAKWEQSTTKSAEKVKNIISGVYTPTDNEDNGDTATDAGNDANEQLIAKLTTKLETVTSFLATEEEAINTSYSNRQSILEESLAHGLITEQTYASQSAELEKKKQAELTTLAEEGASHREKFSKMSFAQQTSDVLSFLETNTSALASESKTWFEINKGLAIANSFINTSEAVTKTLASYPAPINFGLASVVAANGVAQISAIKSQSFDSSGSTSSSSTSITSASSSDYSTDTSDYDSDDYDYSDYSSTDTSGYNVTVQLIGDVNGFDEDSLSETLKDKISDDINNGDWQIMEYGSRAAQVIRGAA
jgi:hypothetical protein